MIKNYKILRFAILPVLAAALFACGNKSDKFDAMGVFESDEILVSSEIGGKILKFSIREGDKLTKNIPVGQIDIRELELNKEQLLKQIASAVSKKIDIEKQTAPTIQQIETAQIEKDRTIRLLKADAATQKNLDDIEAQLLLLKRQLNAQLSSMSLTNKSIDDEIASMKSQIDVIDYKISQAVIASPIDGIVLEKYAYEGEISSMGKPLFKVAVIEILQLKAYVTEPILTQIKLGDKVKVSADFGDKYRDYEGVISWISDAAEFTPKTIMTKDERRNLVYAVKIDVKNDGYLKIGSYGEVKFLDATNPDSRPGIVK